MKIYIKRYISISFLLTLLCLLTIPQGIDALSTNELIWREQPLSKAFYGLGNGDTEYGPTNEFYSIIEPDAHIQPSFGFVNPAFHLDYSDNAHMGSVSTVFGHSGYNGDPVISFQHTITQNRNQLVEDVVYDNNGHAVEKYVRRWTVDKFILYVSAIAIMKILTIGGSQLPPLYQFNLSNNPS